MANERFSDFTEAPLEVAVGICPSIDTLVNYKETLPKVYTALLTQSGTDAPVATVLKNTLGGTVVWTYSGVGNYIGTLFGTFTTAKTVIITGNILSLSIFIASSPDPNTISLSTWNEQAGVWVNADDVLSGCSIEIRVYP